MGQSDYATRYEIVRTIARGGMSDIIEAIDKKPAARGRHVAIKLLRQEMSSDTDIVARFHREARMAASLKSRHVARIFDFGENESNQPYIAMELLQGNDLADEIKRRGAMPLEESASYIAQACEAMIEAHDAGIVHRDLKSPNLFLAREGDRRVLKVLDFGISKITKGPGDGHVTLTHSLFGSPLYMSPETFQSAKSADARSDVWSLGVIFYEMLTGVAPFDADSPLKIALAVTQQEPIPPTDRRTYLPRSTDVVVARALKKDPGERYQTMRELLAAIELFLPNGHNEALPRKDLDAPDTSEDDISVVTGIDALTPHHGDPSIHDAVTPFHDAESSSDAFDLPTTVGPLKRRYGPVGPRLIEPRRAVEPRKPIDSSEEIPTVVGQIRADGTLAPSVAPPPTSEPPPSSKTSEKEALEAHSETADEEVATGVDPKSHVQDGEVADPPTWVRSDAPTASVHAAISDSVKRARALSDWNSLTADTDRAVNISTPPPKAASRKRSNLGLALLAGAGLGVVAWIVAQHFNAPPAADENRAAQQASAQAAPTSAPAENVEAPATASAIANAPPPIPSDAPTATSSAAALPSVSASATASTKPLGSPKQNARPSRPRHPYSPKGI